MCEKMLKQFIEYLLNFTLKSNFALIKDSHKNIWEIGEHFCNF